MMHFSETSLNFKSNYLIKIHQECNHSYSADRKDNPYVTIIIKNKIKSIFISLTRKITIISV